MKENNLDDDLPQFLKDLKEKGDGFKVPEGYFEDMEHSVFNRLESSGGSVRPIIKTVKRPGLFPLTIRSRTATALAAALALILAAFWFICQPQAIQPLPLASTELTEDDLETYVLENVHDFDPEQLAALSPAEITELPQETEPATPKKNGTPSDEIRPEDLEKILDEMTDEELEQIL